MKIRQFRFVIEQERVIKVMVESDSLQKAIELCKHADFTVTDTLEHHITSIRHRRKVYFERKRPSSLSDKELTCIYEEFKKIMADDVAKDLVSRFNIILLENFYASVNRPVANLGTRLNGNMYAREYGINNSLTWLLE